MGNSVSSTLTYPGFGHWRGYSSFATQRWHNTGSGSLPVISHRSIGVELDARGRFRRWEGPSCPTGYYRPPQAGQPPANKVLPRHVNLTGCVELRVKTDKWFDNFAPSIKNRKTKTTVPKMGTWNVRTMKPSFSDGLFEISDARKTAAIDKELECLVCTHCLSRDACAGWGMWCAWTGDGRIPKDLLYCELAQGKRPTGRPQLPYKDVCKRGLKAMNIDLTTWEAVASDRTAWKQTVKKGLSSFEHSLTQQAKVKRKRRKARSQAERPATDFTCVQCGRDSHSRVGLSSHTRSRRCISITTQRATP